MHSEMIGRWNSVVTSEDTVYCLGDFSLNKKWVSIILPQLTGKKILVPGNHDQCWGKPQHVQYYLDSGFHDVYPNEVGQYFNGKKIVLSHLPYKGDSHPNDRYADQRPIDRGELLFHGHVHTAWKIKGRMINVGVDRWDFYPVTLSNLVELYLTEQGKSHGSQEKDRY